MEEITFEEVKKMFHDAIDNSANINELCQNVANKIYQKGFDDAKQKNAHDSPLSDSACCEGVDNTSRIKAEQ